MPDDLAASAKETLRDASIPENPDYLTETKDATVALYKAMKVAVPKEEVEEVKEKAKADTTAKRLKSMMDKNQEVVIEYLRDHPELRKKVLEAE